MPHLDLRSVFADYTGMTDHKRPDYGLAEVLEVGRPEQFRAVGDATRRRILSLILERAATTSQLAEALGQPKGSVGHHLKVLEEVGLVRVVRTRRVRAVTEKYYGRTARLFKFLDVGEEEGKGPFIFFRQAMEERVSPEGLDAEVFTLRHARIPAEKAREFCERVMDLADDFTVMEATPGEKVYGFVVGVYPTDLPELPVERD